MVFCPLIFNFIINRVPTPILHHKSPYQILHDNLPGMYTFKVFGSLCYAYTLQAHRTKLDHKVRKSIFLGHRPCMKGYILLDFHTNESFISRNVIFHEHILPINPQTTPYIPHGPTFHQNLIILLLQTNLTPLTLYYQMTMSH